MLAVCASALQCDMGMSNGLVPSERKPVLRCMHVHQQHEQRMRIDRLHDP